MWKIFAKKIKDAVDICQMFRTTNFNSLFIHIFSTLILSDVVSFQIRIDSCVY